MFCLRSITEHYACLSLAGDFIFAVETYNYFAAWTHRETLLLAGASQRLVAESYENQSNSNFACHYAMLVSYFGFAQKQITMRLPCVAEQCNCQLELLQVINQNVYILLCNCTSSDVKNSLSQGWKLGSIYDCQFRFISLIRSGEALMFADVQQRTSFYPRLADCITI